MWMIDQDILDERIDALLVLWDVNPDDEDTAYVAYKRDEAYQLAASGPSAISTDMFVELVELGVIH